MPVEHRRHAFRSAGSRTAPARSPSPSSRPTTPTSPTSLDNRGVAHARRAVDDPDLPVGGDVLHLRGEADTTTVAHWDADRPTPQGNGAPPAAVVAVDASAAAFLDSTGVALLVRETEAYRRAGGRPQLRNPARAVLQVLRLTGVADLFDVVAG